MTEYQATEQQPVGFSVQALVVMGLNGEPMPVIRVVFTEIDGNVLMEQAWSLPDALEFAQALLTTLSQVHGVVSP